MANDEALNSVQRKIWNARLPLEIRLNPSESRTYDKAEPYLTTVARLTYLPALLSRLLAFYSSYLIADPDSISSDTGYFVYEGVSLKWHLAVGLLYDIYVLSTQEVQSDLPFKSPIPFKLTLHFSQTESTTNLINPSSMVVHDSFINSVKEADFIRSGTAKPIMSLSAADSKALWSSTQENDLSTFVKIHNDLFPALGHVRNIPLRVYLPSSGDNDPTKAQVKVLQSQIPPFLTSSLSTTASQLRGPGGGQPQTLGTALHAMIPSLFPSRRTPIVAKPILHGAPVPMNALLEDLARKACYADGWVNVVVAMTN